MLWRAFQLLSEAMEINTPQLELLGYSGLCHLFTQQTVLNIPLAPIKETAITPLKEFTVWGWGEGLAEKSLQDY